MSRLNGKVAIVTGAAQGIGRAIASRLADEGAKVALADIQFDSAERAASEIRADGAAAIAVALDVTKLDDAIAAADRVERELGPIDILVNNAGWDVLMPFVETTPDFWDKVIAINYRGVLNCCKAIAPRMQARGSGKIISISSDAARVGLERRSGLRGMQSRHHRFLQNARARTRRKSHQRQRRLPRTD